MWGSSMHMLFRDVRVEENSKGVRVEGEDKRSELGAFAHSDIQRMGDEDSAKTEKVWPVVWEDHHRGALQDWGIFQEQRSDCLYQYCYYIEYGGLSDCDLEKHLGRAERMEKQELETSVDNSF